MDVQTAASVAKALVPILRDGSSFARATAIELLSSFYSKHGAYHSIPDHERHDGTISSTGKNSPELISFAVPEILALALDERDNVGAVRAAALSLLVAAHRNAPMLWHHMESVVKHVAPHTMKLMALLKNESLRSSVVKLLSTLAADSKGLFSRNVHVESILTRHPSCSVRKAITIRIISVVTSPVSANAAMEAHAELLSQLVVEGTKVSFHLS